MNRVKCAWTELHEAFSHEDEWDPEEFQSAVAGMIAALNDLLVVEKTEVKTRTTEDRTLGDF